LNRLPFRHQENHHAAKATVAIVIWLGSKAIAFAEGSVRMISLEELVEALGIGIAMPKGSTQWG